MIVFLVRSTIRRLPGLDPSTWPNSRGSTPGRPGIFFLGVVRNSESLDTLYNISRYSLARKAQLATHYIPDLKKLAAVQLPEPTISEAVS